MTLKFGRENLSVLTLMVCTLLAIAGCGPDEYVSDQDFVSSVRESGGGVDPAGGTLPPIGESMADVAHIRVETNELHVGTIANDKLHHTKLKVYNDGKMPLKLTRVDTTCACTQGHIAPDRAVVPANGESWIDVTIDPYRIPGFHSRKVLTITSTDPNQGTVEVGVTAEVDPEFEIETDEIDLGDIKKGETLEKRIRFRQLQEKPITLSGVEPLTAGATSPKVAGIAGETIEVAEAEWKTPGKREYEIVLQIGPELPAGPFERNLILHMDTDRWKRHRIQVSGNVLAPYQVVPQYPARATFKPDAATGGLEANFAVSAQAPISVSDLTATHPDIQLAATPGLSPNEVAIKAILPGGAPAVPLDEVIRFKIQQGDRTFDELVGVRSVPAGGAAAHGPGDGHDHGLGEGHSPDDGHNH